MSELLPCPFCDQSELQWNSNGRDDWQECKSCGATGPLADSKPAAIAAWNRRATSAEVDEPAFLKAVLQECVTMARNANQLHMAEVERNAALRARVEALETDARLMAAALLGRTPDANTQDGAQCTATQAAIDEAVARHSSAALGDTL